MESKTLDKVLLWADRHSAAIVDLVFIIIALIAFWVLSRSLFARQPHEGFTITMLTSNIALPLLRRLAAQKYKRLVSYLNGIAILIIIITFRLIYL
nr:hypothetical protein [uncultured Mucilaginibacter sp.]